MTDTLCFVLYVSANKIRLTVRTCTVCLYVPQQIAVADSEGSDLRPLPLFAIPTCVLFKSVQLYYCIR